VQEIAVATLLQRISNECSAAAGSDTAPNGVDWGSVGIIVENAAKEVRRITGEREVPFRAS